MTRPTVAGDAVACECCLCVVGRQPQPATYRWIGPQGNLTLLCTACCAIWRRNARDDPWLEPQRITLISPRQAASREGY